jgi:nitroreductase
MTASSHEDQVMRELRTVRQIRQYHDRPVPEELLHELLQVARWTGSSRNTQPWHFVVVNDKDELRQLSQIRTAINWVAAAPLAVALVLKGGDQTMEAYDEGRVTERLLIAARVLGLGGGTAWYGDANQQAEAKRILGVPQEYDARSLVALGYPITSKDPRPNPSRGGRKPLSEIVSYNHWSGSGS